MKLLLLLTALLPFTTSEEHSVNSTHYLAAVVEYSPEFNTSLFGLPLILKNIKHFEDLIRTASTQRVDIIVFPEVGLTGVAADKSKHFYSEVPHPDEGISPCLHPHLWSEPMVRLSCAARTNRIYVVVNLNEQCGPKRHNTNVVFNREGVVVSRYRKLHLFNERNVQVPDEKDYSVFHADFGVTFGVAICFDMMFREPLSELVHTRNIRHFIFSTAWYSEVPFLTAVQTQAAWAWSHNSVLLASGVNSPQYGNTGSGIYLGRKGPIKTIFTGQKTTRLLIGRVPKDLSVKDDFCEAQPEFDKKHFESISSGNLRLLNDWVHAFATQLLPLEDAEGDNIKLCHDEFCCDFQIRKELTNPDSAATGAVDLPQYRLFVWNGVRDFGGAATGGVQLCGVVSCRNATDIKTCGMPDPTDLQSLSSVKFSKLEIRGVFESQNTMVFANTMNRHMLPLSGNAYNLDVTKGECVKAADVKCLHMRLLREEKDIQTFAIYNRVFDRDNSNYTHTKPDSSVFEF